MRYDKDENILYTTVTEVTANARRGLGATPSCDIDEPHALPRKLPKGYAAEGRVRLEYDFTIEALDFHIEGEALLADKESLHVHFRLRSLEERKGREAVKQFRGEAYLLGAIYLFTRATAIDELDITFVYTAEDTREVTTEVEHVTRGKLIVFFEKCIATLPSGAAAEINRVKYRLPSMKSVKFPYGKTREGQDEFIRSAYRTIARGSTLYATAPTGTGKTVSALFPAIRAMGNGKCDKVFYLTPKTTTAAAAKECIERLCEAGARIRALILTAKEKSCTRGSLCKLSQRLCPTFGTNKISEAAMDLFEDGRAVTVLEDINEKANRFNVCPYELSLTYAELCDVIICDFNYLFDPDVYIRRFFTEGGRFAFLIDEAHNLGERAREMYSSEISLADIECADILGPLSKLRAVAAEEAGKLYRVLYELLRDDIYKDKGGIPHAAYHTKDIPSALFPIFESLVAAAEDELMINRGAKDSERDERVAYIRDYLYRVRSFLAALCRFDSCYELFIFLDGENIRAKVFCIDTGPVIRSRLDLGSSAVIFSGTLSPINYYRSLLGAERTSDTLSVESPFDRENICVSIMDKITTRISEREDSLPAVCRVIAATLSAKRGNYMIFSPSFAYSEALAEAFRKKYPKIKTILQKPNMSKEEKENFLAEFSHNSGKSYLAAFCVLGGIYSEGIDLVGDRLIGAVIVGIGMPALSYEREAICAYYEEKLEEGVRYAYLYPGMNRVLQAAGRVIRTETDKGVIVLIDDRFDDPIYKKIVPKIWSDMQFLSDSKELKSRLEKFWSTDNHTF